MGRRQSVVVQSRHRAKHGPSVLAGIRVRVAAAVVRIPQVLRGQNQLHGGEAVQSHVQATDQGRQVRLELLRVGRGTRETDGKQRRPAQLLSVPQVSICARQDRGLCVRAYPGGETNDFRTNRLSVRYIYIYIIYQMSYETFDP